MKRLTLNTRIRFLKCQSFGLELLFALTKQRWFFERKIKIGIIILGLINSLMACNNTHKQNNETDSTKNEKPVETCYITSYPSGKELPSPPPPPPINASALPAEYHVEIKITPKFLRTNNLAIKYIQDSIRYPISFVENGLHGITTAQFSIEKDGLIHKVRIVQGISAEFNQEIIRVLIFLPRWIPGLDSQSRKGIKYSV